MPSQFPAKNKTITFLLTTGISLVWLINGLFCKLLNFVPRHRLIVVRILGETHAGLLTKLIGASEVLMFIWILSGVRSRWCVIVQITVVATMNIIEFVCVPDLLLFGRMNIVVAAFFVGAVYINEFVISPQPRMA